MKQIWPVISTRIDLIRKPLSYRQKKHSNSVLACIFGMYAGKMYAGWVNMAQFSNIRTKSRTKTKYSFYSNFKWSIWYDIFIISCFCESIILVNSFVPLYHRASLYVHSFYYLTQHLTA